MCYTITWCLKPKANMIFQFLKSVGFQSMYMIINMIIKYISKNPNWEHKKMLFFATKAEYKISLWINEIWLNYHNYKKLGNWVTMKENKHETNFQQSVITFKLATFMNLQIKPEYLVVKFVLYISKNISWWHNYFGNRLCFVVWCQKTTFSSVSPLY